MLIKLLNPIGGSCKQQQAHASSIPKVQQVDPQKTSGFDMAVNGVHGKLTIPPKKQKIMR
jgi:hypothetical protein